MCNEREVYAQSIAAACALDWPAECLLVQVLDDSSEKDVQQLIRDEVAAWAARGAPIVYHARQVSSCAKHSRHGLECGWQLASPTNARPPSTPRWRHDCSIATRPPLTGGNLECRTVKGGYKAGNLQVRSSPGCLASRLFQSMLSASVAPVKLLAIET